MSGHFLHLEAHKALVSVGKGLKTQNDGQQYIPRPN
jgi:hypothetical protein